MAVIPPSDRDGYDWKNDPFSTPPDPAHLERLTNELRERVAELENEASEAPKTAFDREKILEEMMKVKMGEASTDAIDAFSTAMRAIGSLKKRESKKKESDMSSGDSELTKVLRPLIDDISLAFDQRPWSFMLNQPYSCTQHTAGKYRKVPLIGSEKFEGISAYMGKKKGVIFTFEVEGMEGTIEVPGDEAMKCLDGFEEFVERVIGGNLEEEINLVKKLDEKEKLEEEALRAEELYGKDSDFGAWA